MHNFLFVVMIAVTGLSVQAQSYRLNDTMFVWEMHGADIFTDPGNSDASLGKQYYGSTVRVVDTDIQKFPVKMEVNPGFELQGYWVKVIVGQDTGYVFDGYLSHLKPFDLRSNEKGIALVQQNFQTDEALSKGIRSFENGNLDEGQSRNIRFKNGTQWNIKNIQNCLLETFTYPGARFPEAYQLMMAVYSNYFDQNSTYMAEPEFVRINGNKYEFIIRDDKRSRRITLYKKGNDYIISSYSCPG